MNKTQNISLLLLTILIVIFPALLKAQSFDDDVLDNPVPMDEGVIILIAIALAYGLKMVLDRKKAEKM